MPIPGETLEGTSEVQPELVSIAGGGECIAICDTVRDVPPAISVRLDEESALALRTLEAAGMSRSDAIRSALIEKAAQMKRRAALAAEVRALEEDEADRAEMLEVAGLMESLRAAG